MSKEENFGKKPFDYEQEDHLFEDIYSDSSRDPRTASHAAGNSASDPFSDWNDLPSRNRKSRGDFSYNDFKPSAQRKGEDPYRTMEMPPTRQGRPVSQPYYGQTYSDYQRQLAEEARQQRAAQAAYPQAGQQRRQGAASGNRAPQRRGSRRRQGGQAEVRIRGDIPMDKQAVRQMQEAELQKHGGKQPKRKRKKRSVFKTLLCILLALLLLYFGTSYFLFRNTNYDTSEHKKNQYISGISLKSSPFVENILLLGSDAREGEKVSRSDTMILVSIDKLHGKIKLTSFLRDSYVYIPGHGYNKLNAACTYGGTQLVIDTIEYNYKIKINKYAMVDFTCFQELIDAIGGVDVKVTEKEANYLNRTWYKWSLTGNKLHFDSGESVHLNGEQALMFCRIRKLDSDVMRAERQRRVISAIKKQAMSSLTPSTINKILKNVLPYIQTDIRENQIMNKGIGYLLLYRHYEIEELSIPYSGTWHDEMMKGAGESLVFDIDENATILKNFIYSDKLPEK